MESNLTLALKRFGDKHRSLLPPLEFNTHFSTVDFNNPTFGGLCLEDILQDDDDTRDDSDASFPYDRSSACVASMLDSRRLRCSSRPSRIQVASFISSSSPISTWFDDSPTRSVFTITDDNSSTSSWGNKNQWLDKDTPCTTDPDYEADKASVISAFGPLSEITSSQASESHDSHTTVFTEEEGESTSASENHILDDLDEQLLHSPVDSFAAMCWDAAVIPDKPGSKVDNEAAVLRLSKLYSDAARQYEEAQIRESSHLATTTLPGMKFNDIIRVTNTVPPEVAPWLYVSRKASSVLGLPQDSLAASNSEPVVAPSRATHHRHRRGKLTLGSITKLPFSLGLAKKCKKQ